MTLELRLLGPPAFIQEGRPLNLVRRKSIALLAYLAVTRRPYGREALAGLLWPEFDHESALMNLRRDLSWLRKTLGDGFVAADRLQIAIEPDAPLWLDVQIFDSALSAVQKHNHPPTALCPDCVANLSQAIELYQGDFMTGFSLADSNEFEEWQFFQREEHRRAAGSAFEKLCAWHGWQAEYEQGIAHARRWLALDAWHEPAHRALMTLYAQADQQAAALRQYETCRRVLDEEMGVPPEAETTALFEAIRARQVVPAPRQPTAPVEVVPALPASSPPIAPVAPVPSSLPVPTTPLIGRTQEIAEISALLRERETRLVTLVAPGGMGKTHLSLAVAAALLPAFADGVHFVPLAPLSDPEHIPAAILQSLRLPASGDPPRTQLLDYLSDKQLLLVLDNFEHLLLPAPEATAGGENLVVELLQAAPQVKLLVTSRERLNVRGEAVLVLGGLPLSDGQEIASGGAAQLFHQHARLVRPGLVVQENDWAIINRICRLVEGMPLALILAASWVDMLSLAEIAEEVIRSLDFLETDMADVPPRQRSIRAIFDAAWRRLAVEEQAVFRQLSVFRGGFTRQAAQTVSNASLRTLRALLHKLFVTVDEQGRYQIHELLRQYGGEKLTAAGGDASTRTAHADYFLELLHRREADLRGGRSLEALAEIEADFENIRNAWGWALTQRNEDAINRSLEALQIFLETNGRYPEAIALFEQAQQQLMPNDNGAPSAVWARITARFGFMRLLSTGYADSLDSLIERCLQTAQASDDRFEIAFCRYLNGVYLGFALQDFETAAVNLQQAVTIFREIGDDFFAARALTTFGLFQYLRGLPEGRLLMEQALELSRKVDDLTNLSAVLNNLSEMAMAVGEYGTAERYTQEVLTLRLQQTVNIAYARAMSGLWMILRGQPDDAEQSLEKALEEAKLYRHQLVLMYVSALLSLCASLRRDSVSARQLAEQALPNPTNDSLGAILGQWAMALACAGTDEWSAALPHLRMSIEHIHRLKSAAMITWLLPLTASLLAQANRPELAVQHLALAHTHPLSPTALLTKWPNLAQLRTGLEAGLGEEPFHLAWEAGKVRDLEDALGDISAFNPTPGWPGGA